MKIIVGMLLIVLCLGVSVSAQTPATLDNQVKPKNGKVAMAISCDDMPETMWSVDNPAYLLMSKLSEVLAEGLTKK